MKLENNIVRINGYKGSKRTHIDVEVEMANVTVHVSGKKVDIKTPFIDEKRACDLGFAKGLTSVTSFNYWNWVGDRRMTVVIW
jgi:hypothetical protein